MKLQAFSMEDLRWLFLCLLEREELESVEQRSVPCVFIFCVFISDKLKNISCYIYWYIQKQALREVP